MARTSTMTSRLYVMILIVDVPVGLELLFYFRIILGGLYTIIIELIIHSLNFVD